MTFPPNPLPSTITFCISHDRCPSQTAQISNVPHESALTLSGCLLLQTDTFPGLFAIYTDRFGEIWRVPVQNCWNDIAAFFVDNIACGNFSFGDVRSLADFQSPSYRQSFYLPVVMSKFFNLFLIVRLLWGDSPSAPRLFRNASGSLPHLAQRPSLHPRGVPDVRLFPQRFLLVRHQFSPQIVRRI
jgi:hypothetical protein